MLRGGDRNGARPDGAVRVIAPSSLTYAAADKAVNEARYARIYYKPCSLTLALARQRASMDRYYQVFTRDNYRWPSGASRPAASYMITPDALMARTDLVFEPGIEEGLGPILGAGVALPSGRRVLLLWYEEAPVRQLILEIDAGDHPALACAEVMAALGMRPEELMWIPEDVAPAG